MIVVLGILICYVKLIVDEVVCFVKNIDVMLLGVEGECEVEWVLVDLGDVIVYVMLLCVCEFYVFECLWIVGDQLLFSDDEVV